ncbi:MAG: PQQ-binding-like beta-propeller repeat protein [Chloroflexota bacterium]|nr:PQQ-binding-like beta-propeller repeat protein [Chloroflexota bacterium]
MKNAAVPFILWILLLTGSSLNPAGRPLAAAQGEAAWPSLNYDAAQSNNNTTENVLNGRNVLKLKVRWTAPVPSVSYPVIADGQVYVPLLTGNRVHVRALDIASGKSLMTYPKDALGGLLSVNRVLYLAGHILQAVDPSTGKKVAEIDPNPKIKAGTFLDPIADGSVLISGYASTRVNGPSALYGIDPQANSVLWQLPSTTGNATLDGQRVITETSRGGAFFDETTGKPAGRFQAQVGSRLAVHSPWFAGSGQAYTVAPVKRKNTTLFAYDSSGHTLWRHVVGPYEIVQDWPHAIAPTAVYVATYKSLNPAGRIQAIEALDPQSGSVLWRRDIPNVERIVLANGLLYVLSFSLGEPVRLIMLHASSGKPVGAIVLSSGYYAFNEANGLMVADGMVFIRAAGPGGSLLVALGL